MTGLPWRSAEPLGAHDVEGIRREMIFDCCKWDPQAGDIPALASAPIILSRETWHSLSRWAEGLDVEALAAEQELLVRPELFGELGLPWQIRRALRRAGPHGPAAPMARVVRFDFHLTSGGWLISEVNSDVPGGYIEASGFTELMAGRYPDVAVSGHPAKRLAEAIARRLPRGGEVALVHATAYADDHQVMAFLAKHLASLSLHAHLSSPAHLRWESGRACLETPEGRRPLDGILRFFPAEWLPNLPHKSAWWNLVAGGLTPQCNPGSSILSQSKRFPLIWDRLRTPLPSWRALLPETRDPRGVDLWKGDWVLKPAMGRVGEGVGLWGVTEPGALRKIVRSAQWFPSHWVAQRRFEALPLSVAGHETYPCIGVYVIDGHAAGAYGRIATRPLIDGASQDVAILVEEEMLEGVVP